MDRKKALDQLRLMQAWHEDFGDGPNADYDAICYAINIIEEAPEGLDNLIKALEAEHKKLREMQDVPPEKCEKCMMEHLDEMEKLEVELEMQKVQPHTYRGVTLNDVMMYFDSLEGNEDAWTEFCSCFECRGWGLYPIRSATDKNVGTTDTINRQQAIDAVTDELDTIDHVPQWVFDRLEERLKQLTPAQPEIIRCKDCKHLFNKDDEGGKCWHFNGFSKVVSYDDFCSLAERREVTE